MAEMLSTELDVQAGGSVTLHFTVPGSAKGTWGFGCFVPGHYDAGMHGTLVNVTPQIDTSRFQYKQSMEAQLAHFADALRKGNRPMGGAEEILPVMELLDAVYRSAEQGKEVRLA